MDDKERIAQLTAQLQAAHTELSSKHGVLTSRGMTFLGELADSLVLVSMQAEMGNPSAKNLLVEFLDALKRAQNATGKLVIIQKN